MKRRLGIGLALALTAWSSAAPYQATSGNAVFEYRVIIVNVQGQTSRVRAALDFNPDDLRTVSGSVSVNLVSLETGNSLRNSHMRGALGADTYSDTVFKLQKLENLNQLPEGQPVSGSVTGQFSLKGVTRTLTAPVELSRQGNQVTVATQFTFNPHDFGVNYPGGASSIALKVTFVLTGQ